MNEPKNTLSERHKRTHSIWFHLKETPRKNHGAEGRLVVA